MTKIHIAEGKAYHQPIDQREAQLLVDQQHLAAPNRAPGIAPEGPAAAERKGLGHIAGGAATEKAHRQPAALREAKVVPIVAEERDIETPRCLEIDGLADADTVALAFDGSGRNPQATVVGIADEVVGQPARKPPPLKLTIDFGVAQRQPGFDAVVARERIAQTDMSAGAFLAHEATEAAGKAVVEAKHAPADVELPTQVQPRQRDVESVEKSRATAGDMRENEVVLVVAQHIAQRDLDPARGAKLRILRDLALRNVETHLALVGTARQLALALQALQRPRLVFCRDDGLPALLGTIGQGESQLVDLKAPALETRKEQALAVGGHHRVEGTRQHPGQAPGARSPAVAPLLQAHCVNIVHGIAVGTEDDMCAVGSVARPSVVVAAAAQRQYRVGFDIVEEQIVKALAAALPAVGTEDDVLAVGRPVGLAVVVNIAADALGHTVLQIGDIDIGQARTIAAGKGQAHAIGGEGRRGDRDDTRKGQVSHLAPRGNIPDVKVVAAPALSRKGQQLAVRRDRWPRR